MSPAYTIILGVLVLVGVFGNYVLINKETQGAALVLAGLWALFLIVMQVWEWLPQRGTRYGRRRMQRSPAPQPLPKRRTRAVRQWFVGLEYDGVKLRKYYRWHRRSIFLSGGIGVGLIILWQIQMFGKFDGAFWQWFEFGRTVETSKHTVVSGTMFGLCAVAALLHGWQLVRPFRMFCPHCDETMSYSSPWECPHCHREHGQEKRSWWDIPAFSFLGRCQNAECRRYAVSVKCIHCDQPIPLTTLPVQIPATARQPRTATVARWNSYKGVYELNGVPVSPPAERPAAASSNGATPGGRIRVMSKESGKPGWIDAADFDPDIMERI